MKIMVVDDEIELCNVVYDFFSSKGYEVIKSTNGKDAIEKAKSQKPNLVFLDIRMPGMDGFEVLKEIKKIDPAITVIMETVINDKESAEKAIALGAKDYVTKPLSFDYLEKAVFIAELETKKH